MVAVYNEIMVHVLLLSTIFIISLIVFSESACAYISLNKQYIH